jgi:hypothetical protein
MSPGKFVSKLKSDIVGSSISGAISLRAGIIVSSYYGDTEAGSRSSNSYVDIVFTGSDGQAAESIKNIPVLKMGGVSQSLPIVGSTGIIGYIGGRAGATFLIGYYESELSEKRTEDNVVPEVPPTLKTR